MCIDFLYSCSSKTLISLKPVSHSLQTYFHEPPYQQFSHKCIFGQVSINDTLLSGKPSPSLIICAKINCFLT